MHSKGRKIIEKIIIGLLLIIMSIFITSCSHDNLVSHDDSSESCDEEQNMISSGTLIVEGKDITAGNHVILNRENDYAELPFIAISKALGVQVDWISDREVIMDFDDTKYILNPLEKTLYEEGDSFNMILLPPGEFHKTYYELCDKEVIIDNVYMFRFIRVIGAMMDIDYDNSVVNIYFDYTYPYEKVIESGKYYCIYEENNTKVRYCIYDSEGKVVLSEKNRQTTYN